MKKVLFYAALLALGPVGVFACIIVYNSYEPANPRGRPDTVKINRPLDPSEVAAGEVLFRHEWTSGDPTAVGGDGLGPVYNAASCVTCHFQGGVGGGGSLTENVTVFVRDFNRMQVQPFVRQGILHAHCSAVRDETLQDIDDRLPLVARPSLALLLGSSPKSRLEMPRGVEISQRNPTALFGSKLIEAIPREEILANEGRYRKGRVSRIIRRKADFHSDSGPLGRFGWKAQTEGLDEFVRLACARELGLSNEGHEQDLPLFPVGIKKCATDLSDSQCRQLTDFVASLPRPEERLPDDPRVAADASAGKKLFIAVKCAECHIPNLGGVRGLYSDLLLHDMGKALEASGGGYSAFNGATDSEWRTPPLWGVADSAPYLHDGRAPTLRDAILLHDGTAADSAERFGELSPAEQAQLLAFLGTLRAPSMPPR